MKPFNLFGINHNDFRTMMDIAGELIYVNGVPRRAFISNTRYLKESNDKYISTDFEFKRGDIIYYDNRYWMVITQVGTPRHESYKGMIRQLEHDIIFNLYDVQDRPSKYLLKVPSIVSQTSDFVAEYSRTTEFITITSEIHVIVQDNEKTRRIVELVNKDYGRILFGYRAYDIIGVSSTQKGVLDFTCSVSTFQNGDDRENNIPKPVPSDIEQYLDTSMYEIEGKGEGGGQEPEFTLPTGEETTDISLLWYGDGTLEWRGETQTNDFDGFVGYHVVVKSHTMFTSSVVFDEVVKSPSANIGTNDDLDRGYGWEVEISSVFSDGTVTVELKPLTFSDYEIKQLPTEPPIW